jgi:hypothetical protein
MATTSDPQTAIDERDLGNNDLEARLEERDRLNEARLVATRAFEDADTNVRNMLEEFQLAAGEVARCGRFRIEKTHPTPAKHVEFDRGGNSQLRIKAVAEVAEGGD